MDSSESADQLLTCLELQNHYDHIPFELIRKDPGVITALRILVTRAFLDRNYQKRDTQYSIDSLVIAIVARLLKPVQAEETPTKRAGSFVYAPADGGSSPVAEI